MYFTIPNTGIARIPLNTMLNYFEQLVVITPYRRPPASNTRAQFSLSGIWSSSLVFALALRTFYNSTSVSLNFSLVRHPHSDFNFCTTSFFFCLLHMLVAKCLMHHRCSRGGHPSTCSFVAVSRPWCRSKIMHMFQDERSTCCLTSFMNQHQLSSFSPLAKANAKGASWLP